MAKLSRGSAIPLMTLCRVSGEADASAAGCVSSGDLGMGQPGAEFRKTLVFLSTATVTESRAEQMLSPISVIQSGGNLVWIHQSWPWSRSPEPSTFLIPTCFRMVSEEQARSAFGWDGESGINTPCSSCNSLAPRPLGDIYFPAPRKMHLRFSPYFCFLVPPGNTGCVPPQTQSSPAWLSACQRCPPSSPGSPLRPFTPKRPQACQATSASQQIAHGPHQNGRLPG